MKIAPGSEPLWCILELKQENYHKQTIKRNKVGPGNVEVWKKLNRPPAAYYNAIEERDVKMERKNIEQEDGNCLTDDQREKVHVAFALAYFKDSFPGILLYMINTDWNSGYTTVVKHQTELKSNKVQRNCDLPWSQNQGEGIREGKDVSNKMKEERRTVGFCEIYENSKQWKPRTQPTLYFERKVPRLTARCHDIHNVRCNMLLLENENITWN